MNIPLSEKFASVRERMRKAATLKGVLNLLSWDQETHMPKGASDARAEQIATLTGVLHGIKSDPSLLDDVRTLLSDADSLSKLDQLLLKRAERDILKESALPKSLVEEFARKTSAAMFVWQKAKETNSWQTFAPHLQEVYTLSHEKARYLLQHGFGQDAYTALMDEFEPEARTDFIDRFFVELKAGIVPLLKKVQQDRKSVEMSPFAAPYNVQKRMSEELITRIGYEWSTSRLDGSSHPFSLALHPTDSRITIRSGKDESTIGQLMSALHEAGHSLYEMGLPVHYYGTPLCEPVSLSIHESQSRIWETVIGRSPEFMPLLQNVISTAFEEEGIAFSQAELDALYETITSVRPSFIRTEADEVTYPLHVLLRYEIEKELFANKLSVHEIPARWNSGMKELLGITPPTDREGCLQDIHWSMGMFGYFPTYTLGSWYAVVLMEALERDVPDVRKKIRQGNFWQIHTWLHEHIWSHGRTYNSFELISKALQREPRASDYLRYLQSKYIKEAKTV